MVKSGVAVLIAMSVLLIIPSFGVTAGLKDPTCTMQAFGQKIHSDKKLLVAQNLHLTDSEAKDFWPLYGKYQKDLDSLEERMRQLTEEYVASYGSMSDKTAGRILEEYIIIERDRQKFREYYLTKFNSILPKKKVAIYFQIENKAQAVKSYETASTIPVIR